MASDPEATVRSLMDHLDQSVRDAKAAARRKLDDETAASPQLAPVDDQQRERVVDEAVNAAYYEGLRTGVRRYAWWKNGTQYVGSGLYTLAQALAAIDQAEAAGEWSP